MRSLHVVVFCVFVLFAASGSAWAQATAELNGRVTDESNAVLPGVNVTLSGERLIGGDQTQVTDATGSYRFDRLSPGAYTVKFELQGFRGITREGILISAAFVEERDLRSPCVQRVEAHDGQSRERVEDA